MNILTYSAEMELLKRDFKFCQRVAARLVRKKSYLAAKEACDMQRQVVRKMELLEIQQEQESV